MNGRPSGFPRSRERRSPDRAKFAQPFRGAGRYVTCRRVADKVPTDRTEATMKARVYYWATTAATLAILLESLGAGKKW
jgi:hypothetical protein